MNDNISRRAVMDFVGSMEMCDQITADAYKELICYLEDLPPAEPTFEQIKEYCERRCLTIITNDLYHAMATAYSAQPEPYKGEQK